MECGGGYESPEKRIADLQVMPVWEVHMESSEGVIIPDVTNVVEGMQEDSRDGSHIVVSHLLGENLEVLDDNR